MARLCVNHNELADVKGNEWYDCFSGGCTFLCG